MSFLMLSVPSLVGVQLVEQIRGGLLGCRDVNITVMICIEPSDG
jgi:hypothetical protein